MQQNFIGGKRLAGIAIAALSGILYASSSGAIEFQNEAGSVTGSWDTTLTYGQAWRVKSRDCNLIGTADGGCGRSPNIDDGDLNYTTGLFSRAVKAVTEVSLSYKNFGAFWRGSALYDFEVMDGSTQRTPLSDTAKSLVGNYGRQLDAFVYGKFHLGTMPGELRLGKQVLSWGESTFIQNGLNVINHLDVSALRAPGAELKEGLLPQQMAVLNLQLNNTFSTQAVYLTHWDQTKPEPAGSYYSPNDFATPGGNKVVLGFGAFSDQGVDFRPLGGSLISDFQAVKRLPTREPSNSGQYGLNIKMYLPNFNNGTEFGLYFLNYHSRLPVISGRTGTAAGVANAWGALNATAAAAQALAAGLPLQAAIATAAGAGLQASRTNRLGYVGDLTLAQATEYATIGARTSLAGGNVTTQAGNLATHEYAKTAGYFTEFPEDIKMIGLSFNTQLQRTGIALQGELTFRKDVPLQYDDVELLFAALTPFEVGLGTLRAPPGAFVLPPCTVATATLSKCNQLGQFGVSQEIQGWGLHDTWQFQFTGTKTFTNILKAAQMVVVFEAAYDHIDGFEDKLTGGPNGRGLRYNGPGTSVSGNAELASRHFNEVEPQNRFADANSWGYRLAGRLEYPNLIGPWNVVPRLSWQHDVRGTSPGPGGNFVEGRHGLTLGVGMNLRATWDVDMSWTQFGGAGRYNDLNDRDFVAAAVKYSF